MMTKEQGSESEVIDLVPIVLIAAEVGESPGAIAHRFGEMVVLDDIGMRAVPVDVARRFFASRAEQAAEIRRRQAESQRRLKEREAKQPKVRAIPAPPGAPIGSALAVLMAADRDGRDWYFGSGEFTTGGRK